MPFLPAAVAIWLAAHSALVISTLITVAVNVGLSFIGKLLSPKPPKPKPQGRELTVVQPDAAWQIVYGEMRVGGTPVVIETAGSANEYLYLAIVWCYGGPDGIEEITSLYFGDELAVTGTTPIAKYTGLLTVEHHLGTDAQSASTILTTDLSGIFGSTAKGTGHAYTVLKLKFDPDKWSDWSVEQIRAQIKGRKVLDPRTGSTAWSDNPVLCLRDYFSNTRFGMAFDATRIDDTFNNAQANICDELVAKTGGTEKRYRLNGAFTVEAEPGRAAREMFISMGGQPVFAGGKWRFMPGVWRPPVVEITDDDLRGTIEMEVFGGRLKSVNGIKGTFMETTHWRPAGYPAYAPAALLAEDGDVRLWQEVDFGFVTSAYQCQRLAHMGLNLIRRQKRGTLPCKLRALAVLPGDTIEFTHTRWANSRESWDRKTFYVERLELVHEEDRSGGRILGVNLHVREEDALVYYHDAARDEQSFTAPTTPTFPDPVDGAEAPGAFNLALNATQTYRPTTNPLTAADVGATATVSIAGHTMRVQGRGDVSVSSGSVASLSFDTLYFLYYDDTTLQGGAVSFAATTTKEVALSGGRRFYVGSIKTPPNGGGDTIGNNDGGAGAQVGAVTILGPTADANLGVAYTNPENARDGNTSTAATATDTDGTAKQHNWSGFGNQGNNGQVLKAVVDNSGAFNGGATGSINLEYSSTGLGGSYSSFTGYPKTGTFAREIVRATLPAGTIPSNVFVRATTERSSGTSVVHTLYEVWLEATL